ncbi:hypothetical protein CEUSTIGMA_g3420.t1 [Chlamydomonas eustigma]|uniref:Uncharacterized protein n=1 Tax=Chlamydomonas eustigma TaxID=1157962 RepID=A0A250WYQ7_9CHLO|nr:hypothetical protein CEUSTIGMA_g3420.t1 [Chlamydomonas eustigma]|eukprot:GAX75977.1 hypothetical protein CEUSTIGMA_g3420.t1 [Chlamydomonas eustigma]
MCSVSLSLNLRDRAAHIYHLLIKPDTKILMRVSMIRRVLAIVIIVILMAVVDTGAQGDNMREFDVKIQSLKKAAVTEVSHVISKLMNALEADDASEDLDLSELTITRRALQGVSYGCYGSYGQYGPSPVYPCPPSYYA